MMSWSLVEGELDALACISHGIPAITATTGALTWPDHLSVPFKEKDVVILPDADPAGRKGAQKRAQSLRKAGARCALSPGRRSNRRAGMRPTLHGPQGSGKFSHAPTPD